jgi:hypothetical protein
MKTIGLRKIWLSIAVATFCLFLTAVGINWPGSFMSGNSLLLAHDDRDWDRDDRDRDERYREERDRGERYREERYYEQGFQFGRNDVRRSLSCNYRRYKREYNDRWQSDFRRGYEDGYYNRSYRNGSYRSRGYDGPGYDGRHGDDGYAGSGTMMWRGRVDDYVELRIQGSRVMSRERQGAPTFNERYDFSSPLPRAEVQMSVKKRDGRGRVQLIQSPSRSNGYTAVVAIDDDKGGADNYEIELRWN